MLAERTFVIWEAQKSLKLEERGKPKDTCSGSEKKTEHQARLKEDKQADFSLFLPHHFISTLFLAL